MYRLRTDEMEEFEIEMRFNPQHVLIGRKEGTN